MVMYSMFTETSCNLQISRVLLCHSLYKVIRALLCQYTVEPGFAQLICVIPDME